ncbi:MAG: calcium-binding protein [Pseudomonadota bacterium]
MASFVIATDTQSGQVLSAGEFGFVASSGSVFAALGPAVELNGTAKLVSYGDLSAATASALVVNAASATSVTIAAGGSAVTSAIHLAAISGSFAGAFALHLAGLVSGGQGVALAAVAPYSTLDLGNDGTLQGLGSGEGQAIALTLTPTSAAVITNTGTISTAGSGCTVQVSGQGGVTLTNAGTIANASASGVAVAVEGALTLRNSGHIEGDVKAGLSANIFTAGIIHGDILLGGANDTVRVSGLVMGDIVLGDGRGAFYQTGGRVMGCVYGGKDDDRYYVDRSDTVISDTAGGQDTVFAKTSFQLSPGIENLTLSGANGMTGMGNSGANVILGASGDDVLWGLGGNDALNGGDGNNRLMGGAGLDTLRGGEGRDRMDGGAGADVVYIGYGDDTLLGGAGRDMLRFDELSALSGVTANLTTNQASFEDQSAGLSFSGFEDLFGSAYADALTGSALANTLAGGGGADTLWGLDGTDVLIGGTQADVLYGGKGADIFVFSGLTDSTWTGSDTIKDFEKGQDVMNLSGLDAVLGGLDDAFRFIGTRAFSGNGAEVRYTRDPASGTTMIEVQIAGWTRGDTEIVLTGLFDLTAASFVL